MYFQHILFPLRQIMTLPMASNTCLDLSYTGSLLTSMVNPLYFFSFTCGSLSVVIMAYILIF